MSARPASVLAMWMVLVLGLVTAVIVFLLLRSVLERQAHQRFEVLATEVSSLIQKRIDSYNAVLYGARGLFNARGKVTRPEFNRYFESLDHAKRYPGLVTLNFARHVPAGEKSAFEEEIRRDTSMDPRGHPDVRIFPPGEESHYLALEFIEPRKDAAAWRLLGGDVRRLGAYPTDSSRAMDTARDLDRLATSGRLFRVPSAPTRGVYIVRLPVYRSGMPIDTLEQRRLAYYGSVGHAFELNDMMRAVLPEHMLRKVRIELHDAGWANAPAEVPPTAANLLFDSDDLLAPPGKADAAARRPSADARFHHSIRVDMAGRKWVLRFSDYTEPPVSDRILIWGALAGGVLVSLQMYWLVRSLTGSKQRALRAVAGILHDINQPLSAVTVLTSNAEKLLKKGRVDEVGNNLGLIGEMAERMGRIVGQLRSFARDDDEMPLEAVSVHEAISNAVLLIETQVRNHGVSVEVLDNNAGVRAVANAIRLEQVLLNLLRNAVDAMAASPTKHIVVDVQVNEQRVVVSVADSGPGIDPAVIGHIFEPFYTTKPVGKGLGLGLAISLATVRRFGGELKACNLLEGGARFDVTLKRAEE